MKKLLYILSCATVLFLASCKKELSNDFNAYTNHPLNDTTWLRNLPANAAVHELAQLLAPDISIDSFPVTKDTTLKYGDTLELSFTAGSCVGPGGPVVAGTVKLELFRLKTKGDYIKAFKATTSNGYLLEAAGGFFLRISQEGKELRLAPGASVKIRFTDSPEPRANMQVFNGIESNPVPASGIDTAFNWVRDADSSWIRTFQKPASGSTGIIKGYEMIIKNLRWVTAERFIDSNAAKGKLSVILPLNYTIKNTVAFAVFADQKTVVSLKADYASRTFAAGNIPKGKKFRIVTISKIADDMYLGTKDVDDLGTTAAFSVSPEKKALKDLLQFLNSL